MRGKRPSLPIRAQGFSLMELMISLVVVVILVSIAYPSYQNQMVRARRAEAHNSLLDLAGRMEQFFYDNGTYAGSTIASGNPSDVLASATTTPDGLYTLALNPAPTATAYTVVATPVVGGPQAGDAACATLSLNSLGSKTSTGTLADCW
jgi:type IV pilus assembly protein PilE